MVQNEPIVKVPEKYTGFTYTSKPAKWKLIPDRLFMIDAALLYVNELLGTPTKVMQSLIGVLAWGFFFAGLRYRFSSTLSML